MSFQSILPREGWKSQKVVYFAKGLCRNCLSRKIVTPAMPHARISTIALSQQNKGLVTKAYSTLTENIIPNTPPVFCERLQDFHNELYHAPSIENQSQVIRNTIARRLGRRKLHELYRSLTPLELKQLSRSDVDKLVSRFTTNPDDPSSARAGFEALEILQDVKSGKIPACPFLLQDCEKMVQFSSELKLTAKAERYLLYIETHFKQKPSDKSLESVLLLLSEQKNEKRMDYWLSKYPPHTRDMLRAKVLCMISKSKMEEAADYLKSVCNTRRIDDDLNMMVTRYSESHELMEHILDMFGIDAVKNWRLNEARLIYKRKHHFNLGTRTILKNLSSKCLYTGQVHTMERILKDAIHIKDTTSAQFIAQGLLRWYMKKKNNKHAVTLFELLDRKEIPIQKELFKDLILQCAKAKYHVDTIRLYRRFKEIYPNTTPPELRVHVLRCMVTSRQYESARMLCDGLPALMKHMKPALARLTSRTLYSLCAQTGDTELYETVFCASEELNYNTTHEALTSLIACYLTAYNVPAAKAAFQSVATHTNGPDVVDFNLLMRTVAAEEQNIDHDKILDILKHMKVVGVATNQSTLRTMLSFYPPKSPMRDELYTKLLEYPDATQSDHIYLNNIALTNLLKLKPVDQVVNILVKEDDRGLLFPSESGKHIVRDDLSYQILLDASCKQPKYAYLVTRLYRDMRARGFKPSLALYEHMIDALAMSGRISKAKQMISNMENDTGVKSTVVTWTKIVDGLLAYHKPKLAKQIITHDMAIRNIELDNLGLQRLNKIDALLSEQAE